MGEIGQRHEGHGGAEAILVTVVLPHRATAAIASGEGPHLSAEDVQFSPPRLRFVTRVVIRRPVRHFVAADIDARRGGDRRNEWWDHHRDERAGDDGAGCQRPRCLIGEAAHGECDDDNENHECGGRKEPHAPHGNRPRDPASNEDAAHQYEEGPHPTSEAWGEPLHRHPTQPRGAEINRDEPEGDEPLIPNDALRVGDIGDERQGGGRRQEDAQTVGASEGDEEGDARYHDDGTVTAGDHRASGVHVPPAHVLEDAVESGNGVVHIAHGVRVPLCRDEGQQPPGHPAEREHAGSHQSIHPPTSTAATFATARELGDVDHGDSENGKKEGQHVAEKGRGHRQAGEPLASPRAHETSRETNGQKGERQAQRKGVFARHARKEVAPVNGEGGVEQKGQRAGRQCGGNRASRPHEATHGVRTPRHQ